MAIQRHWKSGAINFERRNTRYFSHLIS